MSDLTWQMVEAAKRAAAEEGLRVYRLPPGYIQGCSLSLTDSSALEIAIGVVDVAGATVKLKEARNPEPGDWAVHEIDDLTYYVYIDKGAVLHIDILDPAFRSDLMGEYHTIYTWRYLGKFVLTSGVIANVTNQGAAATEDLEITVNSDIAEGVQALIDAAAARVVADGKIVTFFQAGIPTATDVGDLWMDSDDGNRLYRAAAVGANEIKAGEWIEIQDDEIAQAISDAAGAQGTADGRVTTFIQTSAPTANATGDLWIDTDDDNHPYRWSGSAWVSIRDSVVITAARINATALQAQFANISYALTIGYTGTGTWDDPDDGDRRVYIDSDEIKIQYFDTDTWVDRIHLGYQVLKAYDENAVVIHDIPDTAVLADMIYGGHSIFKTSGNYLQQVSSTVFTDAETTRTVTSSTINTPITNYVGGLGNVKGALVGYSFYLEADTDKCQVGTLLQIEARYSVEYNVLPVVYNRVGAHAMYSQAAVKTRFLLQGSAPVPVVYNAGTPYITWNAYFYWANMVAAVDSYYGLVNLYILGPLV